MNRQRHIWLALLAVATLALIFGSSWSVRGARPGRIKIERDVGDVVGIASAKTTPGYDPYSERVNYVGAGVLAAANALAHSR